MLMESQEYAESHPKDESLEAQMPEVETEPEVAGKEERAVSERKEAK